MRTLILAAVAALALAGCADQGTDWCTTTGDYLTQAEAAGFTKVEIGGQVVTLERAWAIWRGFCLLP